MVDSCEWSKGSPRPRSNSVLRPLLTQVQHETTTPSSTHPRVSTRTGFVRLLGLLPSYFHSRHEPVPCPLHPQNLTRPSVHALLHPQVRTCAVSCLTSTAFKSHSVRRTSAFLQVAVLKAPPHHLPSTHAVFPGGASNTALRLLDSRERLHLSEGLGACGTDRRV